MNRLLIAALLTGCTGVVVLPSTSGPAGEAEPGLEFECAPGASVDPGPTLVRRLTVVEYVNTVGSTLGVDIETEAVAALPRDLRSDGFSNTTSAQVITLGHVEELEMLARLAASSTDVAALVSTHASCTDFTDTCERGFLESLGALLFRAPLIEEEALALLPIFGVVDDEGESFTIAAGLVLEAMLQSPRFFYRVEDELGGESPRTLSGIEMASRLSYLVWNTSPDAELYRAAAADELTDDVQLEGQVRRMLADPQARAASIRYITDWLNLRRLDVQTRTPERFPDWTTSLGIAMREETSRFFEYLIWQEGRPLTDVYNAQVTFASPELAAHYGFGDPVTGTTDQYDLSGIPERGGFMTQGSILAVGGEDSSMVSRGLFYLEAFLCGHLNDPPSGVDTTPPEIEPGLSQRSYSEERVRSPTCGGCHRQMEPLAWGLERFDATGVHNMEDRFGNPLEEDGQVVVPGTFATVRYRNVAALMDVLSASDRVRDCMSLAASQYAMGRPLTESDGCSLAPMRDRFAASDGTYQDLVVAIALSPGLRTIGAE